MIIPAGKENIAAHEPVTLSLVCVFGLPLLGEQPFSFNNGILDHDESDS